MDPRDQFLPNPHCPDKGRTAAGNIKVHSHRERRFRCMTCRKTFAATTGTPFYRLHKDPAVFVSTVGGARLVEPASDLAIAIALASSALGTPPPQGVVALGEISLAGEVRKVRDLPQRLAEAPRLGFRVAVAPMSDRNASPERRTVDGMTVLEVAHLQGALTLLSLTGEHRMPTLEGE